MATLAPNPLTSRLTGHQSRLQRRLTLWLPFALGMAISAMATREALFGQFAASLRGYYLRDGLPHVLEYVDWWIKHGWTLGSIVPYYLLGVLEVGIVLLYLILPLIIAVMAASLTANDSRREAYTVLSLTNVSDRQLVWAYLTTTLYRLRAPLAFVAGLLPLLTVVEMLPTGYVGVVLRVPWWFASGPVQGGLVATVIAFSGWLLFWLAAAVGVWLGLWWRNALAAASVAPVLMLVVTLVVMVTVFNQYIVPVGPWDTWWNLPRHLSPDAAELFHVLARGGFLLLVSALVLDIIVPLVAARWARKKE